MDPEKDEQFQETQQKLNNFRQKRHNDPECSKSDIKSLYRDVQLKALIQF